MTSPPKLVGRFDKITQKGSIGRNTLNMKKILIVNNDQKNSDSAVEFFSFTLGYDFVCLNNRKDAEIMLPSADVLITDANIKYSEDDCLANYPGYNIQLGEEFEAFSKEETFAAATGMNSWSLILQARAKEIPNIMIGTHGTFKKADMLYLGKNTSLPHKKLIELIYGDNRKDWQRFSVELDKYWSANRSLICWTQHSKKKSAMKATDWSVVWQQMQKQIKSFS